MQENVFERITLKSSEVVGNHTANGSQENAAPPPPLVLSIVLATFLWFINI